MKNTNVVGPGNAACWTDVGALSTTRSVAVWRRLPLCPQAPQTSALQSKPGSEPGRSAPAPGAGCSSSRQGRGPRVRRPAPWSLRGPRSQGWKALGAGVCSAAMGGPLSALQRAVLKGWPRSGLPVASLPGFLTSLTFSFRLSPVSHGNTIFLSLSALPYLLSPPSPENAPLGKHLKKQFCLRPCFRETLPREGISRLCVC